MSPASRSPPDITLANTDGSPIAVPDQLPLAVGRVRFVGEAVALIVAETLAAAKDAAELVVVDYQPSAGGDGGNGALRSQMRSSCGSTPNVAIDAVVGDAAATEAAFASAAHIVAARNPWVQRVTGVPMEPRTAVGELRSRRPAATRSTPAAAVSGARSASRARCSASRTTQVRVVAHDVGGNFGTRNGIVPGIRADLLGGEAHRPAGQMALRAQRSVPQRLSGPRPRRRGRTGARRGRAISSRMRGSNLSNLGAHAASFVPLQKGIELMTSLYRMPVGHFRGRARAHQHRADRALSQRRPAGGDVRDGAADRPRGARVRLRPGRAAPPQPDPGDGAAVSQPARHDLRQRRLRRRRWTRALALADWDGFPARREEARRRGKLRGIGVANYVEMHERLTARAAEITVLPDGAIEVAIGTLSSGQGHETSFAQLRRRMARRRRSSSISLVTGDTDRVPFGGGSHSGRSMRLACDRACGTAPSHHCTGLQDRRASAGGRPRPISSLPTAGSRSRAPIERSACSRSPLPRVDAQRLPDDAARSARRHRR